MRLAGHSPVCLHGHHEAEHALYQQHRSHPDHGWRRVGFRCVCSLFDRLASIPRHTRPRFNSAPMNTRPFSTISITCGPPLILPSRIEIDRYFSGALLERMPVADRSAIAAAQAAAQAARVCRNKISSCVYTYVHINEWHFSKQRPRPLPCRLRFRHQQLLHPTLPTFWTCSATRHV